MLEISVAQQTIAFLTACLFGMVLGAIYDIFRIFRIAIPCGKIAVFIHDIIFWIICATLSFLFMLYTNAGEIRFFYIFGESLGFCIYYFTIGILVYKSAKAVIEFIKKLLRIFAKFILEPIWQLLLLIIRLIYKILLKVKYFMKKKSKVCKTHLQVDKSIVYNLLRNNFKKKKKKKKLRRRH